MHEPATPPFESPLEGDIPLPNKPGRLRAASKNADALDGMELDALLSLRDEIDKRLPAKNLCDISLEEELVLQFMRVRELQQRVLEDNKPSAQQKAIVANSVASTLGQLIKMQADLHTAERFKTIENLMIKAIKRLPKEVADAFVEEYERIFDA